MSDKSFITVVICKNPFANRNHISDNSGVNIYDLKTKEKVGHMVVLWGRHEKQLWDDILHWEFCWHDEIGYFLERSLLTTTQESLI